MSISPTPDDPYLALGVSKDADIETIKKSHRKLVLKHHPDRFTDPAQQAAHRDDFEKAQQAYELLADPQRRQRYDNEVKLAELRKERMFAEQQNRSHAPTYTRTTYSTRSTAGAPPSVRREEPRFESRNEGRFNYEERAPDAYFDTRDFRDQYDEPRSTPRKSDPYERKTASSRSSEKKEKKGTSGWERAAYAAKTVHAFKDSVKAAKEKAKTEHAEKAKARDTKERQERSEKQASARYAAYAADAWDSDSDTVVAPGRRPNAKDAKSSVHTKTKTASPKPARTAVPPRYSTDEDSMGDDDLKHERQHQESRDYIVSSRDYNTSPQQRPKIVRTGSDAHTYWHGDLPDQKFSSSPEKPQTFGRSPNPRRTATDEARTRPPIATANSAPGGLKPHVVNVSPVDPPPRTRDIPERPRKAPDLKRYPSDPVPNISRKDSVPMQGSRLKQEMNHDSGYGSSSSQQQSPPLRSQSPPRSPPRRDSGRREPLSREPSSKYTVDPSDDRIPRSGRQFLGEEFSGRRYASPEDVSRGRWTGDDKRDRRPSRSPRRARGESEARTRSSKTSRAAGERRPSLGGESTTSTVRESVRAALPKMGQHRKLFAELADDGDSRRYEQPPVKTASYGSPKYATHAPSSFRSERVPMGSRRPSATAY